MHIYRKIVRRGTALKCRRLLWTGGDLVCSPLAVPSCRSEASPLELIRGDGTRRDPCQAGQA